uniref:TGF_BETA_2 domain-containing protein n=1 Tax=Parastrongyloides trichosuri TaxID=131310 RepID=A0A0N4Z4J4_PARTI
MFFYSIVCFLIFKISYQLDNDHLYQQELLLRKLLNNFHLSNPINNFDIDKHLKYKFQEVYKHENLDNDKEEELFSEIKIVGRTVSDYILEFENSNLLRNFKIIESFLYFKYAAHGDEDSSNVGGRIKVFNIEKPYTIGEMLGESIIKLDDYENQESFSKINLKEETISEIFMNRRNNLLMMFIPKVFNQFFNMTIKSGELIMKVVKKKRSVKRSTEVVTSSCDGDHSKDSCCMKTFEIDFELMNWDFIISPRTLKANYCYGECKGVFKRSTISNALSKLQDSTDFKYKSCCHPIEYRPINVTIFINKSIVETKVLNDLLIKKCSCY